MIVGPEQLDDAQPVGGPVAGGEVLDQRGEHRRQRLSVEGEERAGLPAVEQPHERWPDREVGAGGELDTETAKKPIIGFIFSNKGLMYNLTFEGSKITKLDKDK